MNSSCQGGGGRAVGGGGVMVMWAPLAPHLHLPLAQVSPEESRVGLKLSGPAGSLKYLDVLGRYQIIRTTLEDWTPAPPYVSPPFPPPALWSLGAENDRDLDQDLLLLLFFFFFFGPICTRPLKPVSETGILTAMIFMKAEKWVEQSNIGTF